MTNLKFIYKDDSSAIANDVLKKMVASYGCDEYSVEEEKNFVMEGHGSLSEKDVVVVVSVQQSLEGVLDILSTVTALKHIRSPNTITLLVTSLECDRKSSRMQITGSQLLKLIKTTEVDLVVFCNIPDQEKDQFIFSPVSQDEQLPRIISVLKQFPSYRNLVFSLGERTCLLERQMTFRISGSNAIGISSNVTNSSVAVTSETYRISNSTPPQNNGSEIYNQPRDLHAGLPMKVICDNSLLHLATGFWDGKELNVSFRKSADNVTTVEIEESVRGIQIYILSSVAGYLNDQMLELLKSIEACRLASAGRVVAVVPVLQYASKDKKDKSRAPISAKLVVNMLSVAGADEVIVPQFFNSPSGTFLDIPVTYCDLGPLILNYIKHSIPNSKSSVIVSPDAGGAERVSTISQKLKVGEAHFDKEKNCANEVEKMTLDGSVEGKVAILVDDVADTCGTICMAADKLVEAGADKVYAFCVHGIFSGPALTRLNASKFEAVVVTNTIPQDENMKKCPKIRQIDIGYLLADTIGTSNTNANIDKCTH